MTSKSERMFDVLVVGAGPAGLAAATSATRAGARTAIVDAGVAPGGQYWRHPAPNDDGVSAAEVAHLHHDLATYHRLVAGLRAVAQFSQHHVWTVTRDRDGFVVHVIDRTGGGERAAELRSRRLILAPGAYDRQIPFPGWDLPGVMTAGGVQALLKGHAVVAGQRVLVAGTGPFLLPVAAGLAESGANVVGVHEAASPLAWLSELGAVIRNVNKLGEGAGYARVLARQRIPVRTRSVVVSAHGTDALERVTTMRLDHKGRVVPGSERTIAVDVLAVGWGFTPQLELPLALGCATRVDVDGSLVCEVDDEQRSSVEGVFVAGEACGVGGAALATVEGEIAGTVAAGASSVAPRLRRSRAALRRFAQAMHQSHPVPAGWVDRLSDDTTVCRCEEVPFGALRSMQRDLDAHDGRSAKMLTRAGMGYCQARTCGYAIGCILGQEASPTSGFAERPVSSPLTLGALATSSPAENDPPPAE
ncbi:FAD-dependent oxidoreductase [Micromonospora sp. NPDC048930]|uniref:FAD-dependent oxidoreductase n=1 Tax=Micromonospora sp. NPDC048930 TaxID=3364261 RepID=UPI003710D8BF